MLAQEIETSEPMLFETPAAQRGSAVACHEQVLSPPVTTRELFVLWYPRCERRVSFHRVTLRCKPLCIANPRVRRSTVHHAPPCALLRGSGMFSGLRGNVWHPRCDRRPAFLVIRICVAHHGAPRQPAGCTELGTRARLGGETRSELRGGAPSRPFSPSAEAFPYASPSASKAVPDKPFRDVQAFQPTARCVRF